MNPYRDKAGSIVRTFVLMLPVVVATASAHPGHGEDNGQSVLHYVTTFQHLLPVLLAFAAVIGIGTYLLQKKRRNDEKGRVRQKIDKKNSR